MKKIYSSALLLLLGAVALTSCKDDRDSNPTLVQPTEFRITGSNATAATIDLENTKEFTVSWTLPTYTNFGASVIPTYIVQVSPTGAFTKEFVDDAEDKSKRFMEWMPDDLKLDKIPWWAWVGGAIICLLP